MKLDEYREKLDQLCEKNGLCIMYDSKLIDKVLYFQIEVKDKLGNIIVSDKVKYNTAINYNDQSVYNKIIQAQRQQKLTQLGI